MIITIRTIRIWLVIFLPFLCLSLFLMYIAEESTQKTNRKSENSQVGKKFQISSLYDQFNNEVFLDLAKNKTTIIDFWYVGCKPCIEEMAQFSDVLSKTDDQITIVSISLDKPSSWRQLLSQTTGSLSFLSKKDDNWEHYVLSPKATQKNPFSVLNDSLGVKSYPAYFVVDTKGYIVATPASAIKYLNLARGKVPAFINFAMEKAKSKEALVGTLLLFVFYSGLYWILIVFTFVIKRMKAANKVLPKSGLK